MADWTKLPSTVSLFNFSLIFSTSLCWKVVLGFIFLLQRYCLLPVGHLCSFLFEDPCVLHVQRFFDPLGHLCSLLGLKTLVFFPGSEALTSSRTLMFSPGWSHKYVLRVQRIFYSSRTLMFPPCWSHKYVLRVQRPFCSSRTLMFPPELRRGPSGTDPMPLRPRWSLLLFLLESHNSGFLFTSSTLSARRDLDVYLVIIGYHYYPN